MDRRSDPHRFKKLAVKQLPKVERLEGGDEKFWRRFQVSFNYIGSSVTIDSLVVVSPVASCR